jgi:hypothetical protein
MKITWVKNKLQIVKKVEEKKYVDMKEIIHRNSSVLSNVHSHISILNENNKHIIILLILLPLS